MSSVWAVVPAAGVGKRMGATVPKQYLEIHGRTVLEHTLERLADHRAIAKVIVAVAAEDALYAELETRLPGNCVRVTGGQERCHSVLAGLEYLESIAAHDDWVLVHDAARPCVRPSDIDRMLVELEASSVGGILAVPVRDTLKRCDGEQQVIATVDRNDLWHALTPQMFRLGVLADALRDSLAGDRLVTDEAQAIELAGLVPQVVQGHADNLKITQSWDLQLASIILQAQGDE